MNPSTLSTLILYRDRKGRYRWHLKAANGNKIAREAHGPGYASAWNRNEGVRVAAEALGSWLWDQDFPRPGKWLAARTVVGLTIRNDDDK